jgi:hypothetical protein
MMSRDNCQKLSNNFWTIPDFANELMTRKELREVLLDTGGQIIAHGRLRNIKSKHIGAGVYKVTLESLKENDNATK